MKQLKITLLSIAVALLTAIAPFLLIIHPIYQKHIHLKKEEISWGEIQNILDRAPNAISKKAKKINFFQKKLNNDFSSQALEENLNKNHIFVESMRPYQGSRRDETHLIVIGKYRNLLRFIAMLSRQPNSMDMVYLSIDKKKIELVLKDNGGA